MKPGFFVLSVLVAGTAGAQADARRGPAAPDAPVPRIEYRSAFAGYRPLPDEEVAPWRGANDAVKEQEEGHRGGGKPAARKDKPMGEHHGGHR